MLTRYTAQPRDGAITYYVMLSSMMKPLWLFLASSQQIGLQANSGQLPVLQHILKDVL